MPDTGPLRIVDLNAKTTPGASDLVEIVDVSDVSDPKASDPQGSNKKVTFANFAAAATSGFVPTSTQVNGHALTGNITVTASDVGLGNVLNTSTANTLAGYNAGGAFSDVTIGSGLSLSGNVLSATGGGTGTVTSVSVVTANGFAGSVATATTTPAITLTTTVTGIPVGNGTSFSASVVTNDVQTKANIVPNTAPTAGQILAGNAGGTAYAPVTLSGVNCTATLSSTGALTLTGITNTALQNNSINLSGGTNFGMTIPGTITLGGSFSIGSTGDNLRFNNLGLNVAPVATNSGQITTVLSANNTTAVQLKRSTDTAPTGMFFNCLSAAGAALYTIDITGTVTAGTWNGSAIDVPHGGTALTSLTAYAVLCGGTTSTGPAQQVSGVGTSGQVLTSNGPAALPTWQPAAGGGGTVIASTNDYRLTLQTGTPVPSSGLAGQSTVYLTPFKGDEIATFDSSVWTLHEPGETSVTLAGLTTGKNYDVFAYFLGGTFKIDLGPTWNAGAVAGSDTARGTGAGSTDLVRQNGVWVNTNALTTTIHGDSVAAKAARYIGTIRSTGATTTEDSAVNRFVWNLQNKVRRELVQIESTSTWSITATTTPTWGMLNGSTGNRVNVVVGLVESQLDLGVYAGVIVNTSTTYASVGIQEDGTGGGAASNQCQTGYRCGVDTANGTQYQIPIAGYLKKTVPLGFHFYQALQWALSGSSVVMTIIGSDTSNNSRLTGLVGTLDS